MQKKSKKAYKLSDDIVKRLSLAGIKKIQSRDRFYIDSIDYSKDGNFLISGCEDNYIRLYSMKDIRKLYEIPNQKYGADLVRFTHSNDYALFGSRSNKTCDIRYLGLKDKKFVRYFTGHSKRLTSLVLSPNSDQFISSSLDHTIRFWDIRMKSSSSALGKMHKINSFPRISISPCGLVLAVACEVNTVKLFSLKSPQSGPFKTIKIDSSKLEIRGIKFSPDGDFLLLFSTSSLFLLDSFSGKKIWAAKNKMNFVKDIGFTPNSKYVCSASDDGYIQFWKIDRNQKKPNLVRNFGINSHSERISTVKFNPKYLMCTSTGREFNFWLPNYEKKKRN